MRKLLLGTALAALAFSAPAFAGVINGSFEDVTNFVPNSDNTMSLLAGSTAMTGWTVTGDSLAWIGPSNPFSLSASNGGYFLDLTDYTTGCTCGGVTQTIATSIGALYRLTFDLGSSSQYGLPDSLLASAGSQSGSYTSTLVGTNNWESEFLDFTATGLTTAVTLQGTGGTNYIGLDNVSIELLRDAPSSVPEPATLALFGAGLAGLAARRRKAKKA